MANQTQLSALKIGIFRKIASLIFPSDDKGRARSAEIFSIYNSLSYGLLKNKGRAQRGQFFKFEIIFLNFP